MTTFGTLSCVAFRDLGPFGPREGPPVEYEWSFLFNAGALAPWLIVLLLLVRPKNANLRAWSILVPVAIFELPLQAAAYVIGRVPGLSSLGLWVEIAAMFILILAALWLLADKLSSEDRILAFVGAALIVGVMAVIGSLAVSGFSLDASLVGAAAVLILGSGATLVALVLGGVFSRKDYSPFMFILWMFLWATLPIGLIGGLFALVSGVAMLASTGTVLMAVGAVIGFVVFGVMCGIGLGVLLLPFVLLSFVVPFYRDRFYGIYRLKGMMPCINTTPKGPHVVEETPPTL